MTEKTENSTSAKVKVNNNINTGDKFYVSEVKGKE